LLSIFSAQNSGIKEKERTKKKEPKEPKEATKKVKGTRATLSQSGKNIIIFYEYFIWDLKFQKCQLK
jgi:hypothetical protein